MARLLIINYAFPPFGGAASRRVAKMVKYLDRLGHQCVVVTAPRIINPLTDQATLNDVPQSTAVIRTLSLEPVPRPGRETPWLLLLRRAINVPMIPNVTLLWAICAVRPAIAAAKRHKPDAVLCSAPEFPAFLVGAAVKAATGLPLILDYRDEWSFHPEKEQSVKGSPLKKIKQSMELALERRLARYADRVIANTDAFKEQFIIKLHLPADRIKVIPNGFDPDDFPEPGSIGPKAASSGPDEKTPPPKVVTFLGSVDHESLLGPELLAALDRAAGRAGRPVELRLVGNIYPELRRRIEAESYSNIELISTGFLPARKALARLFESDLNLLVIDDIPGKERYHNLKLFDYLRAGAPLLVYGPAESMMAEVAMQSGLGNVVERGDEAGLYRAFTRFLNNELAVRPDGDYIRGFAWSRLAGEIAKLIEELGKDALPGS
jgi:glycosyltransferase involved in cell wall biosynthesis